MAGLQCCGMKTLLGETQNYSRRHINAIVKNKDWDRLWKFTGFYSHPDASKRHKAWSLMRHLAGIASEPWVCAGDFN